ncbi:hypothetical protein FRC11_013686, partial [Ceratobasidium sp. 423]
NDVFDTLRESNSNISENDTVDNTVRILRATTSLLQLDIFGYGFGSGAFGPALLFALRSDTYRRFTQKLATLQSDPTFLPNLAVINELSAGISLDILCPGRPVVYRSRLSRDHLRLDIYPELSQHTTVDKGTPEVMHSFSAKDVGSIIRKIKPTSPLRSVSGLDLFITMRFPDEVRQHKPFPVTDPPSWVRTMLATADLFAEEFESINVEFEPPPPYQPIPAQYSAVQELHRSFPSLET